MAHMATSSAGRPSLARRVCWRVGTFLSRLRRGKSWQGPSCTCRDFRDFGRCKHLDMFKAAALANHAGGVGGVGGPLGTEASMSFDGSLATTTGATGSYASAGGRRRHKPAGSTRQASWFPDDDSESEAAMSEGGASESSSMVLSTSRLAISNSVMNTMTGQVVVPGRIRRLSCDLTLLDNIGRGAYGRRVFRATCGDHGIVLAKVLRVMPPTCLPHHNELFNNELDVLQSLQHPNLVSFKGYQEVLLPNNALERRVVFEFAVDSLGDLVHHRATGHDRLSYIEVRKYSLDIIEAVAYLHDMGISHRDLSSDNVVMVRMPYPSSGNWASAMRKHFRLSRTLSNIFGGSSQSDKVSLPQGRGSGLQRKRTGPARSPMPSWLSKSQSGADPFPHSQGGSGIGLSGPGSPTGPSGRQGLGGANAWNNALDANLNVVGPNYTAKLANFEVARRVREDGVAIRHKTRVTSPQYMSPEMFRAETYDESIDVWAFGSLLYEMLAKERPFHKHYTLAQIEELVCHKRFPPRGHFAPTEFRPLEKLMHQCLEHDASKRPSAVNVLADLKRLL